MMWAWIAIGVAVIALALTFGLTARKAFGKIGRLEAENEALAKRAAIAEERTAKAVHPRPTLDELRAVSRRMSQRPEDN